MSRVRAFFLRLLLVPLSLVVLLGIAEIGLRIASHFVSRERGGAGAATTILCVGDSHTFGLHVIPALSYPSRLQNALDPSGESIGVVNYGVPGRNSSALLASLPDYLDRLSPDLVLILVGFNDSWNFDATRSDADDAADSPSWFAQLRVTRLFRILRLNLAGRASSGPKVVEKDGKMMVEENGVQKPAAMGGKAFGVLSGDGLTSRVRKNLEKIVARVRAHGATPVLLDYATENQSYFLDLNANARATAADLGVPFIEIAIPFRAAIAQSGYSSLFFDDDHPNARGNEYFAALVADGLKKQHLVPETASRPSNSNATVAPSLDLVTITGLLGKWTVHGPPHREFQIAFSPRSEPPIELRGTMLPIGNDPMLARCLENPNLRGRTDASGSAEVECDLSRIEAKAGTTLFGVVAFFSSKPEEPPATSPVRSLALR